MSNSTQTSTPGDLVQEVTMEEVYDALMGEVEPELTLDAMQYHDAWFADESDDEREVRMIRYEEAFATVAERMATLLSTWKMDLQKIKRTVMKKKECDDQTLDASRMSDLQDSINDE